jgi:threonine dehydrogenase-like Zn-dependent dehydrogenase
MQPATKGIAGHEGAGVVVSVGDDMHHKWKVGDRAGIKWVWSVCGECEFCTNGSDELHCPNQKNAGFTAAGTFQQYALSDGKYTTRIPDGVTDEEAGPIMCGGVTAYTACKRSGVKPGQWIVSALLLVLGYDLDIILPKMLIVRFLNLGPPWRGRWSRALCSAICKSHGMTFLTFRTP